VNTVITIPIKIQKVLALSCLFVSAITLKAGAQMEAMPGYVVFNNPDFTPVYAVINGPVGWTFQPLTDISVTALGMFDGLPANLEVGLWNSSGTLLVSETIDENIISFNQSRYESITPVALTAGQTYYLAAFSPSGEFQALTLSPNLVPPDGMAIMSPDIQLGSVATENNGVFQFPDNVQGVADSAIIAANFEFAVAPEPATLAIVGAGLSVLLAARRRISS
jgi:hypothetical protein